MKFKIYKAKLQTGGKTADDIIGEFEGDVTEEEIQNWIKAYNLVDGIEVIVTENFMGDGYILVTWLEKNDVKIRDFTYQAEQDEMFGTYIDEREEFLADWNSKNYSPNGMMIFREKDIEILEKLTKK